jgi:hypothetical protein
MNCWCVLEILIAFFVIDFIVLFIWAWMNPGVLSAGSIVVGFLAVGCFCALVSMVYNMWIAKHQTEKKSEMKLAPNVVEKVPHSNAACQYEWPVISNEVVFLRVETQS